MVNRKKVGEWKDGLKDGKWNIILITEIKLILFYLVKEEYDALEFDRFGVVKSNEEETKFNEMLKNKLSIEAV